MAMFSKQEVFCGACGKKFRTDFQYYQGRVCGEECLAEIRHLEALAIMGRPFAPRATHGEQKESSHVRTHG